MAGAKIALCIPTKDRFECIKELLLDFPRINNICPMDVYIYDSSTNDVVKSYIESYDKTYNIYYKRIKEYHDADGNVYKGTDQAALKLYDIYSEFTGSHKYDYVWVSGDSIRFSDKILDEVSKVENDCDLITVVTDKLNEVVYAKRQNVIWDNAEEYVKYNTANNTLFGSVLVSTRALEYIKWDELSIWYKNTKYLSFAYIRLYAEATIQSPKFKGISIFDEDGIQRSKYKIGIGWQNNFFDVFYECFINVINSFPVNETYKEYIKDYFYKNNILIDEKGLEYMRIRGDFDMEQLKKWKEYIEYSVPYAAAKKIADTPLDEVVQKQTKMKKEFVDFLNSHEKVYIYGAGYFGMKYQAIVEHNGHKIDGFIVSKKGNNPDFIDGYKVLAYDDIKENMDGAGIILGLNQNNATQVKSIIKEHVQMQDIYENYDYQVYIYM